MTTGARKEGWKSGWREADKDAGQKLGNQKQVLLLVQVAVSKMNPLIWT